MSNVVRFECDNCNTEGQISVSNFDFELVECYEAGMGRKAEYSAECEIDCIGDVVLEDEDDTNTKTEKCECTISVTAEYTEYPEGVEEETSYSAEGATII